MSDTSCKTCRSGWAGKDEVRFQSFFMCVIFCALINISECKQVLAKDGCVTTKCHEGVKKAKYLHGPVAANECGVCLCHISGADDRPPKNHVLSYDKEGPELCLDCHEKLEQSLTDKTVHSPVEDDCTICHDPHHSDNKFLLTEKRLTDICFICHEDDMTTQKYVHGPVAGGDCIVCHNPHASQNEFLLTEDRLSLCFSCHEEKKDDFKRKYVRFGNYSPGNGKSL